MRFPSTSMLCSRGSMGRMARPLTQHRIAMHVMLSAFARIAGDSRCAVCRKWLSEHKAKNPGAPTSHRSRTAQIQSEKRAVRRTLFGG